MADTVQDSNTAKLIQITNLFLGILNAISGSSFLKQFFSFKIF